MKILSDKKISRLKNEVINKMYEAVRLYHEREYQKSHPDSDLIKSHNHDEVLDIVLGVFYQKPEGKDKYEWSKGNDLSNLL